MPVVPPTTLIGQASAALEAGDRGAAKRLALEAFRQVPSVRLNLLDAISLATVLSEVGGGSSATDLLASEVDRATPEERDLANYALAEQYFFQGEFGRAIEVASMVGRRSIAFPRALAIMSVSRRECAQVDAGELAAQALLAGSLEQQPQVMGVLKYWSLRRRSCELRDRCAHALIHRAQRLRWIAGYTRTASFFALLELANQCASEALAAEEQYCLCLTLEIGMTPELAGPAITVCRRLLDLTSQRLYLMHLAELFELSGLVEHSLRVYHWLSLAGAPLASSLGQAELDWIRDLEGASVTSPAPERVENLLEIASAFLHMDALSDAERTLNEALAVDPTRERALVLQAEISRRTMLLLGKDA